MKGGGLALIFGKNVTVTKIDQKQHRSFESAQWRITIGNKALNILGLYHPPYSLRQKITNSMFIDDLTDYLTECMTSHRNIIICGDFNIYIIDLTLKHKYLRTLLRHQDYNNMSTSKLIMLETPLTYYLQKLHPYLP